MTSSSFSADSTCSMKQARELLEGHLATMSSDPSMASRIPPIMFWGPPGAGKSTLVRDVASAAGIGLLDIRLSQREPVDIRGLPVPRDDGVHWLLSAEWPRDPESRGIIIFDELTAADRTLQVAAYELILDRRLGDLYSVPHGWYIVAAGNRQSDRAVANIMSSALASRFLHIEIEPSLDAWAKWAVCAGINPAVIAFLRFRPELLSSLEGNLERGWPNPRAWERVSFELNIAEQRKWDKTLLRLSISGLVGAGAASEFLSFLDLREELPDVRSMMADSKLVWLPERADQIHALCSSMVHYLWCDGVNGELLSGFFRISLKLSTDFAVMAMMNALTGRTDEETNQRRHLILSHPDFESWLNRHGTGLEGVLVGAA